MSQAGFQSRSQSNNIADIYPLSPMQEGILFHSVSAPESGQYMPQTALRISGEVDDGALKKAWQETVDRHPVLRSGFYWEEQDEPFQIVFKSLPLSWSALDWSGFEAGKHDEMLSELFASNRSEPFNLRRPPLLRVQWIRTGPAEHILVVCYHHIILDGWSIRQLLDDALLLYRRQAGAETAPLPTVRPYGDYIGWLRKQDRATSLRFWREYLSGSPGPTRFLRDDSTGRFARHEWQCPGDLFRSLRELCARSGCTMSTLLQGALGLLMSRQTGMTDLIFGTTTAGRPGTLSGSTSMIGLFINTLPVRVVVEPGLVLETWILDHQKRQAATIDHEYVPLREIQGSGGSLFDTLLVVENFKTQTGPGSDMPFTTKAIGFDEQTHFPLTIWATPKADSLTIMIGYRCDAIASTAIAATMRILASILSNMTRLPRDPLGSHLDRIERLPDGSGFAAGHDQSAPLPTPSLPAGIPAAGNLTPTEALLSRVWTDLLRCGTADSSANFFELGGHSLMAARVISRLRSEFSIDLPVRTLFDRPVLADLAAFIDALRVGNEAGAGQVEVKI